MLEALRSVGQGKIWFSPRLLAQLLKANHKPELPPTDLTENELIILRHLAQGLRNKEIAQRLHVSHRTVEFHLSNILRKLRVASRLEAVAWFWQNSSAKHKQHE